jgi:endo-1,4-beta-xylanase
MGEDYIAQAFRKAREADPNALLFMNDYGLEADDERWDAMLALVTRLKKQGVPIDGVGFQSHVYEEGDRIPTSSLRHHMQQLAKIGLKARISEIDVYAWGGSQNQASQYTEALKACLAEANCVSYTTWGISDRYNTYKEDSGAIAFGEDFLWDTAMKPTLAVTRMKEALRQ